MDLKERIKYLCKIKHISMNSVEESLGFAKGYLSKLDKSKPNSAKMIKIAEFFNVSVEYLMTGINSSPTTPAELTDYIKPFSDKENELVETFSRLQPSSKEYLLLIAKELYNLEKKLIISASSSENN